MKINFVMASASRLGGGLFSSALPLAKYTNKFPDTEISITALRDKFSKTDLHSWAPIIPHFSNIKGPASFGYSTDLSKQLILNDPSLIHLHGLWAYTSSAVRHYAKKHKKPVLISPHGMLDPWAIKNSFLKKKLAGFFYENKNLRNAFCIHSLSNFETKSIRNYGLTNKICQIPNGVDIPLQHLSYEEPPWFKLIPKGRKILLFLGRIHPKKGIHFLIEAWKIISGKKKGDDWVLVIAGWDQNEYEDFLKKQVVEYNLQKDVFFVGPQFNDLKYSSFFYSDAFILPSLSEGIPMAVLESWAYKLPVIMTAECNIPLGFSNFAAIEIRPDSQNIANALISFFQMNEWDRKKMGKNGFSLVSEKYAWDKVSSEMKLVYDWILGGGPEPNSIIL
jgi:glycosyltransferase involved in cell wall biosynthesis